MSSSKRLAALAVAPLFAIALTAQRPQAAVACTGEHFVIVNTKVVGHHRVTNGYDTYKVAVTVTNQGASAPGNLLDSVALYLDDDVKSDVKGLTPLAAGASQTVVFSIERSNDGGMGTTTAKFTVVSQANCGAGSTKTTTF